MKLQNLYLINLLFKRRVVGSQEKRSRQESEAHPLELIDTAEDRLTLVQPQCLVPDESFPRYFSAPILFSALTNTSAQFRAVTYPWGNTTLSFGLLLRLIYQDCVFNYSQTNGNNVFACHSYAFFTAIDKSSHEKRRIKSASISVTIDYFNSI